MIPYTWIKMQEAEVIGYVQEINFEHAISKIEWNQPYIAFSISNVKKSKYDFQNYLTIRLDGPLVRLKLVLYNVILVSCSTIPILAAILILSAEFLNLIFVVFAIIYYRYHKNWLLIISRVNVSIGIIFINLTAFYLSLT